MDKNLKRGCAAHGLMLAGFLILSACSPAGDGPDGPDGQDGQNHKTQSEEGLTARPGPQSGVQPGAKPAPELTLEPMVFEAADGTKVEAEKGTFQVPENRLNPTSRMIEISFVRFKATGSNPGAPIVYLAGGPGGSGTETARRWRFSLFMALREFGDVIAFDQRGTGLSHSMDPCVTDVAYPLDEPLLEDRLASLLRAAGDKCASAWRAGGVDLSGYNTAESARDIADLRRALGADKISLWGISYGSHLGFATMKEMEGHIDRVILTAIEGLDATVKLPANTDRYFDRLQAAIDEDADAKAAYPDLKALMRRVHTALDETPVTVTFKDREGAEQSMVIGKTDMQFLSAASIADPRRARFLPATYRAAEAGDYSEIAPVLYHYLRKGPLVMEGMPEAMDIMSGISDARLAEVEDQARTALLGTMLNFPMPQMRGAMGLQDLGEAFRAPVVSDVPTLVFVSTLDGRTYPEGADIALAGLSNLTRVTVKNGGHNVYMQDPVMTETILAWMRGEEIAADIDLPAPKFVH